MDLFSDLIQAVQDDLTLGNESSFMDLATVKRAINRAYRNKVAALFRWPDTEDAKKTSAKANQFYYDYPQNWRPNSIWKLVVDGEDYGDPLVFKDFEYEKENDNPSGLTKMWANKARRYFFDPIPTADGTLNIVVHGQRVVDELVSDGDVTIFSYSMPECNEAIVLEAVAILKSKGEEQQSSDFISTKAKQIVVLAWGKLRQEQSKYEKTQPFWDVQDMFGRGNSKSRIGNFDR